MLEVYLSHVLLRETRAVLKIVLFVERGGKYLKFIF